MNCAPGCIYAIPGHAGACLDTEGAELRPAAPTLITDRDAPRATSGQGGPPVVWALPWACPDCKAWGYIGVCVENRPEKTTDEILERWMMAKHRKLSPGCLRPFMRMLQGRLRRREKAGDHRMIFMLKKGEDEHTVIDVQWPPWEVIGS